MARARKTAICCAAVIALAGGVLCGCVAGNPATTEKDTAGTPVEVRAADPENGIEWTDGTHYTLTATVEEEGPQGDVVKTELSFACKEGVGVAKASPGSVEANLDGTVSAEIPYDGLVDNYVPHEGEILVAVSPESGSNVPISVESVEETDSGWLVSGPQADADDAYASYVENTYNEADGV